MKNVAVVIILLLSGFNGLFGSGSDLLDRKLKKEILRIFGEGIEVRSYPVPEGESEKIPHLREGDLIFTLSRENSCLGYILSTRAKGRFDYFDYSVVFSDDLSVLGITVTVYRSTQGAGICNKRWLEQFRGYSGGELRLGKEIDTVSGATISAGSMVTDIQRCRNLMDSVLTLSPEH